MWANSIIENFENVGGSEIVIYKTSKRAETSKFIFRKDSILSG